MTHPYNQPLPSQFTSTSSMYYPNPLPPPQSPSPIFQTLHQQQQPPPPPLPQTQQHQQPYQHQHQQQQQQQHQQQHQQQQSYTTFATPQLQHPYTGSPSAPYPSFQSFTHSSHVDPPPGSHSGPFLPPNALPQHVPQQHLSSAPLPNPYSEAAVSQQTLISVASPQPHPAASYAISSQPMIMNHSSIVPSRPHAAYPYYPTYYPNDPSKIPPQRLLQTAEVRLEISAKGLRDRDITSKSDPTCVIFLEDKHAAPTPMTNSYSHPPEPGHYDGMGSSVSALKWREIGRTDCIKNNLNPHFKVQVKVPYHFEELQHIRLGLWDIDSKKTELRWHDYLGDVRTTLGELVAAGVWTSPLSSTNVKDTKGRFGGKRDLGTITVIVHENQDGGNLLIKASLSGQKLDRKDFIPPTSDPYFIVTQIDSSSPTSRCQLYESEVIPRTTNPVWKPCQFKAVIPKGGNKTHVVLEFVVNDRDRHSRDDEIGVARCSVAELEENTSFPLINEAKKKRRKWRKQVRNSGILEVNAFSAVHMPSLVDYLQGGLKLHFSVAVDLTASNGPPNDPSSLHYRSDMYGGSNHYVHALTAVANVLSVYTPSDNRFAAFGFGAELPGNPGITNSCFPLGLGPDPSCIGIQGILQAYSNALASVKFSGPTFFAPLIEAVSRYSAQRPNTPTDQNYDVLLILTDGVVSDYVQTVDRIIAASRKVPLSIIIIGIGKRDFQKMKVIDGDDKLLTSADGTRQASRDICQFVAFNEFLHAPPERLGAEVLQELPGNIVEYFIGVCDPPIMPGQRPAVPNFNY